MLNPRLREFFEAHHVDYRTIPHPATFTACETAASSHVPGDEMAKAVMVKVDGKMAMAVLPSTRRLNLRAMADAAHANRAAELAREQEFTEVFADCEPGAMPPFGNLYGVSVYVDKTLCDDEQIAFNAGTHREVVRMPYGEFERLVHPTVARLSD